MACFLFGAKPLRQTMIKENNVDIDIDEQY